MFNKPKFSILAARRVKNIFVGFVGMSILFSETIERTVKSRAAVRLTSGSCFTFRGTKVSPERVITHGAT